MKRIFSLLLLVAMLVGCVTVFTACVPKNDGAEISVYLGSGVYDFDPSDYYADSNADQLMSLLYEPLFKVDEKGRLEKAAAKKYDVDENERKIVIDLRETYWSDNSRVTAGDYVYAIRDRILNPNNPNPAAALFYDIENAAAAKSGAVSVSDVGFVASENYQITITYREGADYEQLLYNLASVAASPVKSKIASIAPTYWSKLVSTMVFNGPFKISTLDTTTGAITLARNVGYHQNPEKKDYDNKVNPGKLKAEFTVSGEEVEVSYADIQNKTVFYMTDASMADRAANKDKADVFDDTSVYSYVFNTNNPTFANPKVRQALSLALDREAIAAAVSFGKAANGFIPDFMGGSSEELISTSANMEAARELLSGVELTPAEKRFTLTVDDNEESRVIAELAVAAWEELGFKVTVKYAEPVESVIQENEITDSGIQWLVKEAALGNYDFDVLAVDWQLYTTDSFVGLCAFSSVLGGGGYDAVNREARKNIAGWYSASYDSVMNSAYKSTGDKRAELLEKAEKLLCEALPVCPILFNETFAFESKEISRVDVDAFGNLIFTDMKQRNYKKYLPEE